MSQGTYTKMLRVNNTNFILFLLLCLFSVSLLKICYLYFLKDFFKQKFCFFVLITPLRFKERAGGAEDLTLQLLQSAQRSTGKLDQSQALGSTSPTHPNLFRLKRSGKSLRICILTISHGHLPKPTQRQLSEKQSDMCHSLLRRNPLRGYKMPKV